MSLRTASRAVGLKRTLIREIFDAAPAGAINLGLGQPDLPTPAVASLAGIAGIAAGRTTYTATAGDAALRRAVAERHAPFAAGPENVVITVGSQEAAFAACLALVDPGREVLYPEPGYPAYPTMARLVGARPVPYLLRPEDGFRLRAAAVLGAIGPETALVILSAPANPTGACHPEGELRSLLGTLEARQIPWLSDEVYAGFHYAGRPLSPTSLGRCGVLVGGVSKELSMTGWRVGWAVAPLAIVPALTAIHQHLVTCACSISQIAAAAGLGEEGRAEQARYLERFRRRRELMAGELARVPGVRFTPPDGGFYFFVDVSAHGDSLALARRILERRNVITIPGEAFGPTGCGYLRLSFAAREEDIVAGLGAIAAELSG